MSSPIDVSGEILPMPLDLRRRDRDGRDSLQRGYLWTGDVGSLAGAVRRIPDDAETIRLPADPAGGELKHERYEKEEPVKA